MVRYSLQFPVEDPTRPLDYSDRDLPTLNETDLDEDAGVGGSPGRFTIYGAPGDPTKGITNGAADRAVFVKPANGPIDWNGNGGATNLHVIADINYFADTVDTNRDGHADVLVDINSPSPNQSLAGFDDWQNLVYNFRTSPDFADGIHSTVPTESEMTEEDLRKAALAVDFDGDGIPNGLDNCPSVFNPDQADRDGNGIGDVCDIGGLLADLALTKTVSPHRVVVGGLLTYSITVINLGPGNATNVTLIENLPDGLVFGSANASQGICRTNSGSVICDLGFLLNSASATITILATPTAEGSLTNRASIFGSGPDFNVGNNQATVIATVAPPGPQNDDFANAQALEGNAGSVNGSNAIGTKELGEPNHADDSGGASVWYRWMAPGNGSVTFDTAGSDFDTLLALYTGSSANGLTTIASNDDVRRGVSTSSLTTSVVGGTTYYVAVDGYGGGTGMVVLNWNSTGPPRLSITMTATHTVVLSWPASAEGFTLETTPMLSSLSSWSPATNAVSVAGDNKMINLELLSGPGFFRLKKP